MILCHGRDPSLRKEAEYEGAPVVWWFECSVCGRTSDKGHHADLAEQSWNDGWEAERTHFVELPAPTPPVIVYQEEQLYGGWLFSYDTLTYDHTAALEDSIRAAQRAGRFYPAASPHGSGYAFDRQLMESRRYKQWRRFSNIRPVTDPLELSVLIKTDYETQMWEKATASFVHSRYAEPAVIPTRSGAELEMIRHQMAAAVEARERETWQQHYQQQHRGDVADSMAYAMAALDTKRKMAEMEKWQMDAQRRREAESYLKSEEERRYTEIARANTEAYKLYEEQQRRKEEIELLEKRKQLLIKELGDLEYRVSEKEQALNRARAARDSFELLPPQYIGYPVEGPTITSTGGGSIAYMDGYEVARCGPNHVIGYDGSNGTFSVSPMSHYNAESADDDGATSYHIYDYNTEADDDD